MNIAWWIKSQTRAPRNAGIGTASDSVGQGWKSRRGFNLMPVLMET